MKERFLSGQDSDYVDYSAIDKSDIPNIASTKHFSFQ